MTTRLVSLLVLALSLPALRVQAQNASPTPAPTPTTAPTPQGEESVLRDELVVVTASRQEEVISNAPATMSVITNDALMTSHAQNYGDLLRSVPGMNAIQMSARDINITSRAAAATLSNSQLGLLDGRTIYLDLFGFIIWDFVPINPVDVKQIEVVRGPASAVWGANALTGAVNIITKSPREAVGTHATFSGGQFSRDAGASAGEGAGNSYSGNVSLSRAPSEKWAFRVSGGYSHSDAFARPTGTVPVSSNPADPNVRTGGGQYPTYENQGTDQPKIDVRVDQDLGGGARMTYSAGYAGTSGIIHTGIGPFDIQDGSRLAYGRVGFSKGNFRASAFTNQVDVEAPNRVFRDPVTREFVLGIFKTQTYDIEAGNSHLLGRHQILSYGGNLRRNNFDISIADNPEDRDEFGGYVQDEIYFGKFRFTLGTRLDKFAAVKADGGGNDVVLSPRATGIYKPFRDHTIRASFNKAYRSPSVINNSLLVRSVQNVNLSLLSPALAQFPLVVEVRGQKNLKEEAVTAYELAYSGTFGRTLVGVALYRSDLDDNINFVSVPATEDPYTVSNPPPGFPPQLAPAIQVLAARGIFLPRLVATYKNLGPIRNEGLELDVQHSFGKVTVFGNYSWQREPKVLDDPNPFPAAEINAPPENRYNLGISVRQDKVFGSLSVNHSDKAFWTDVLTPDVYGPTDAYTMVNATLGVRWNEHVTFSAKATNLANDDIQQHIFGDILKRNVVGELRLTF
jgi:outer membrane receptor protein involved in Fe transport